MTPFQAFPYRKPNEHFSWSNNRQTSAVTGPDLAETQCAEIASPMAIASPKSKEELVRQFKFNPEVDTRLEAFMKAEPGLVQFVKELPREQLERKFLLRKMRDQQQKHGYDAKVKAWLEKPEQAELVRASRLLSAPK